MKKKLVLFVTLEVLLLVAFFVIPQTTLGVTIPCNDQKAIILISEGITISDAKGKPLQPQDISIISLPMEIGIPLTVGGIISAYDLKPDGATFSKPIDLSIKYDPSILAGKGPIIKRYDYESESWIPLNTTIDPEKNTATTKVNHFTIFALFQESEADMRSREGQLTGQTLVNWSLVIISIMAVIMIIVLIFLYNGIRNY